MTGFIDQDFLESLKDPDVLRQFAVEIGIACDCSRSIGPCDYCRVETEEPIKPLHACL